jgi:ankyrin repeat protein
VHVAASKGHTESVMVLLELGADVTSKRHLDGATPLWLACSAGHLETASALLDHPNIDANERNNDGVSPLECACTRNHLKVAELLISKGVSSSVDPSLWMGLRFGSWMMRKQIPELAAKQRIIDEQLAKEEAERLAQEELLKAANEKKKKKPDAKKPDKKEKKKR